MPRGGKRKGAGAKRGSKHDSKRKLLASMITDAIARKCIDNLIMLANGNLKVERLDKSGSMKIFTTPPDKDCNMYLIDQKYGKPKQRTEIGAGDGESLSIQFYLPEKKPIEK